MQLNNTHRPRIEVADIIRVHGDSYCRTHHPSLAQQKVMRHIADCRTAALGGHVEECDACGRQRISYNSCRDRHCPKCQAMARADWLEARLSTLLPVPYFHVVFTIPEELNALILGNQKVLFNLLFATASSTLRQIAADKAHLGAEVGFTAVLHTWGQNLSFHPHLHCVVTGGGLSPEGNRWISARPNFFLSVKVLAKLFRGKFLARLKQLYLGGKLHFGKSSAELAKPIIWQRWLAALYQKKWVVYAKPPFAGPEQVFRYLGQYTHRVAISNHRLLSFSDGFVRFRVKDYAAQGRPKELTLDAIEFLRRFLLHILPKGYTRIRHFGLCAGRNLHTKLEVSRRLLGSSVSALSQPAMSSTPEKPPWWKRLFDRTGIDLLTCTLCGNGRFFRRHDIDPLPRSDLLLSGNPSPLINSS